MQRVLLCGVLAIGLSACNDKPIVEIVPTDPRVLNGHWSGELSCLNDPTLRPIDVYSNAIYIDKTTYSITGKLIIDNFTYNFNVVASGMNGVSFLPSAPAITSQTSGIPQKITEIKGPLYLNDKVVGNILAFNYASVESKFHFDINFSDGQSCISDINKV